MKPLLCTVHTSPPESGTLELLLVCGKTQLKLACEKSIIILTCGVFCSFVDSDISRSENAGYSTVCGDPYVHVCTQITRTCSVHVHV